MGVMTLPFLVSNYEPIIEPMKRDAYHYPKHYRARKFFLQVIEVDLTD